MNLDEAKAQIKALQSQIEAAKQQMIPTFNLGLQALFESNPMVKGVSMGVNNHEFNDGDATYFSLYYDDLTLELEGGSEIGGYDHETPPEQEKVVDEFVKFFSDFDADGFYEDLFSEAQESLRFTFDGTKVSVE